MAYYDYAPDINPLDDEEERRRRAAIEAQAAENNPMGRGPVAPDFGSVVGQAFDKRIGAAQDRMNQVGQMFSDPAAALQQRLLGEQQQAAQDEAANTEVKTQTIKSYQDGSQERIVKTQVPAGQAQQQAQPAAPMMGPVAPDSQEAQQQAQQFAQQQAQYRQPQARGPSLTTPIPGMPQNLPAQGQIPASAAQVAPQMAQLPRPGPAVQVAGATQMPPPAAVAAAPGASLAQAGQVAQAQAQAQDQENGISQQPAAWVQAANDAGSDLYKLLDVAAKHPESRDMVMEKSKLLLQNKTKEDQANSIMKAAQEGDLKAMNQIQQAIKPEKGKPKEEITVNDYLKAVLYKRLGLDAMALDIQNKIIGKETKFGQVSLGGSNWEVETDPSGQIIRAKDDQGTFATTDTLNKLRAGAQKFGSQAFGFTGESNTIPQGQPDAGQEYRQRTNSISGAIENVITTGPNANKIYSGPPGSAKSVGTSYSKALNDAFIKYQTAPTIEMAKKMAEIAGQVDDGSGRTINAVMDRIRTQTPQIFNQMGGAAPATATATAPAGTGGSTGTAPPTTPIDANAVARTDRSIAEIDREIARATQSTAVDPARKAQQLQVLNDERNRLLATRQSMTPAGVATPAPGGGGGGSLASQLKTQTEAAQEVGTDLGKIRVNQSKTEQNADYLLTKMNELIDHKGFSVSVGATVQPGFQYIPGTDKASWYSRFEEVKGQSFLQGIESLRGMGALSNQEGEAATKAVQRMSTSQSEAEFKAAVKDFNEVIQRGIDRNREKLGQPPKYGTPLASEGAKQTETAKPSKLSPQDKQAVEWARQNPNDPRAAAIKKRLGL